VTARKAKPGVPLTARPDPAPPEPEGELCTVDTIVERPDLGLPPEWGTFIRAGDRIPAALAGFPRRPAK
jgi:hypothetical protein